MEFQDDTRRPPVRRSPDDGPARLSGDDSQWLRELERKRRRWSRMAASGWIPPADYFIQATRITFALEQMELSDREVASAVLARRGLRDLRSRQWQRIRNHVAILYRVENGLRKGLALKVASVVRWYTSVSCGLSTTRLTGPTMGRLENVVRRINFPHLGLHLAIQEIGALHAQLLTDPLAPSFNGILARLLLRYHLGRCGLPMVLFDPAVDRSLIRDAAKLPTRLLELINRSYDSMLGGAA